MRRLVLQGALREWRVRSQPRAASLQGTLVVPRPQEGRWRQVSPWSPPGRWGPGGHRITQPHAAEYQPMGAGPGRREHTQTGAHAQACQGREGSVSPPKPPGPLTCTRQGVPERRARARTHTHTQRRSPQPTPHTPRYTAMHTHNTYRSINISESHTDTPRDTRHALSQARTLGLPEGP